MVLKRFQYENGLDIIAPLKCGTRWLENETNPIKIEELSGLHKIKNLTKDTYFLYRDGKEHLLSALKTEIRGAIEFNNGDVNQIISSFLNGTATHWSPIIFEFMYIYWNRIEFKVIELNHLSNLFPGIPYDSNNYNMNYYHKSNDDISKILEMISKKDLDILYDLIEKYKPYLTKILNGEHGPIKFI